jgi:hypothetical protein
MFIPLLVKILPILKSSPSKLLFKLNTLKLFISSLSSFSDNIVSTLELSSSLSSSSIRLFRDPTLKPLSYISLNIKAKAASYKEDFLFENPISLTKESANSLMSSLLKSLGKRLRGIFSPNFPEGLKSRTLNLGFSSKSPNAARSPCVSITIEGILSKASSSDIAFPKTVLPLPEPPNINKCFGYFCILQFQFF